MNRGLYGCSGLSAALALSLIACSGSDGKPCTITQDDAGVKTMTCPDGTKATLGGNAPIPVNDAGATNCTIASTDAGSKIICPDGTQVTLPAGGTGAPASACTVVSNGDGTSAMTCPGGDGGMVTLTIKNALVSYATMSAEDKATLDLKVAVSSVTVAASGKPVIAFRLTSASGDAVAGLPPADMRFALLKLVPATTGGNDNWVSYMAADAASVAGTETAAATASATNGALTDNGDGTYIYTFAKVITDPAKAGTAYDPAATHRFAMQISESGNPFAPVNFVKDFVPATGKDVTGQADKVDGKSCLECHSSFRAKAGGTGAFHGGTRYDLRFCVACHNDQRRFTPVPGTGTTPAAAIDATTETWTGNAVTVNGEAFINLPVFIHKLHMGEQLSLTGGTYSGISKPYEITYPQDVRNCVKCHRAPAAQAITFMTKPSRRACGSCHDGVSFSATAPAGKLHTGKAMADDSTCTVCHAPTAAKSATGIGILEAHVSFDSPAADATWLGGTNANTNAGYLPAAGTLPPGAAKITYTVKSVTRDASKHPSIVFQLVKDGTPVVFKTYAAGTTTELMDGFVNSPSVYFAFAVPQDGIATPADFNATASGYIKNIWNGTATGGGAGIMTFDATSGFYTITLTGVTIPDTATMLIGGVGYTYSLSSTPPLIQINLPAFPYGDGTVIPGCIAGKMCGGLIVAAPDVAVVATDATSSKAYATRRPIVSNDKCLACHAQLGANPSFHAGQRNDGPTCAFCHRPNQTSSGWSASSASFIHGIHGASERTVPFNWHATCPTGTTFPDTCTVDNADSYAKVTYPGILNNCQQCHVAGTYDFSATASAAAVSKLLMTTVATGTFTPSVSTAPYVATDGTDYGVGFSTANITTGTQGGVACTTAAPCVCTLAAPCEAAATTLVKSPITAACSSCHDAPTAIAHMRMMGGTFYGTRASAMAQPEQCMLCHGPGTVAAIAAVHN